MLSFSCITITVLVELLLASLWLVLYHLVDAPFALTHSEPQFISFLTKKNENKNNKKKLLKY